MRSARPKVLHTLVGQPMIAHVLAAAREAGAAEALVILGHEAAAVRAVLPLGAHTVVQEPQLGTGHAVRVALDALPADGAGPLLILAGDMPLVTAATLRALLDLHAQDGRALSLLSARVPDPYGYGRIVRDAAGQVTGIHEQSELAPGEGGIDEINCGVYCAGVAWLRQAVSTLQAHSNGEYYLPDIVPQAIADGGLSVLHASSAEEGQGVNTRVQLAAAEAILRTRINEAHMLAGVTLVDPATTYIAPTVRIGQDTVIFPNTHLRGSTVIAARCQIGPDSEIVDSTIEDGTRVTRSVIVQAHVGSQCIVGPFSYLRHGAILEEGAEIGACAEVKNSTIGPGSVSHHFSYIGDTTMGARVNVGAGTVTCNYDGVRKHRTTIGDDVFVGSGSMLRAPITLGDGSYTGAGSVVTRDVAPGKVVFGVPAREKGGQQ